MTDASDEGVAGCLFVVRKPDARDVTMEDLQNHEMATLISVNSKILDEGQRTWNTHETELPGLVRMVEKHGSYTSPQPLPGSLLMGQTSKQRSGSYQTLPQPLGDGTNQPSPLAISNTYRPNRGDSSHGPISALALNTGHSVSVT